MGNGVVVVGTEAGTRDGRREEVGKHIQRTRTCTHVVHRKVARRKVGPVKWALGVGFQTQKLYLG